MGAAQYNSSVSNWVNKQYKRHGDKKGIENGRKKEIRIDGHKKQ